MAAMDQYVLRETLIDASKKSNDCWNDGISFVNAVEIMSLDLGLGRKPTYLWVMSHPARVELRRRTGITGIGERIAAFELEWCGIDEIVKAADILIERVR